VAAGEGATAQGFQSAAVGQGASAGISASGGVALGQGAQSGAQNATAIGSGATSGYTSSTALGHGAGATAAHQVVLGTSAEDVIIPGGMVLSETATPATLVNASTMTWTGPAVITVTAAGALTGLILAAGTVGGQALRVINESAFTLTFAAAGTSNVADGVSDVIAALTARDFVWDSNTSLWYRLA